ncbi:MAG TPA: radical SAM protein [Candidatus Omnitrophota bacterium]|nr:radical SAM protein [Candidatus Omnitrophota bacterium]HPS19535.1 radical SAM protein [Candidatus Omnitrophota bacterium]
MQKKTQGKEIISDFLKEKMSKIADKYGRDSREYKGLALQYVFDPREEISDYKTERRRHYEADIEKDSEGHVLKGVERLYRRAAVIELTTACFARCRWCLRANYNPFTLSEDEIVLAAKYFGNKANRENLREILITGGDPLAAPGLLNIAINAIMKHAPNIEIIRIGTRLPVHKPSAVFSDDTKKVLRKREGIRLEIGTQINHPIELFKESQDAYKYLLDSVSKIYNQQVLLKDVNDDIDTLAALYDSLRRLNIESHYMFHCVPIRGMRHHRTTIAKGLELIKKLTSSGCISGRSKPMYTAMTDIGKITFYENTIIEKRADLVLLQSSYKKEERLKWNPLWKMPESCEVDDGGYLRVWYKDAEMHNKGWRAPYAL